MNRYDQTKVALLKLLPEPEGTLDLYAIGEPLVAQGFSQDEITNVLLSLEAQKVIELLPGNCLRVTKRLPEG
ncbi:hypothetical protein SAMN02927900_04746 [Rhizobium mongolense subsp. loessense]|uniref:DprA winged helix domain-containing protein n=1 Tax=Rhizobium mongolense subsp. loessense TaxID=158890 RepID=A0A1G4T855_9HYPH|nr:hypothetical protein SAMN02927900_04746 [Rhizobium mongolense subsp. loessense]